MDARFGGGGGASGGAMLLQTHVAAPQQMQQHQHQQHQQHQIQTPASWSTYFPGISYTPDDRRAALMHELVAFFSAPGGGGARLLSAVRLASQHYVLPVDADELVEASGSADLSVALEMQPLEALACISAAAHEALFSRAHALAIAAELLRGVADGELRQQLAAAAAEAMCGGDGGGVAYGGGGGDGGGCGRAGIVVVAAAAASARASSQSRATLDGGGQRGDHGS